MKEIRKQIGTIFQLQESEVDIFLSEFVKMDLKKNDVFIEEGKVCTKVGLIQQGLMKCIFNKEGEEVIFEFAFENHFISDYYSFLTNTPSLKQIQCLEDTTVFVITKEKLEVLGRNYPFIETMSRKVNEQLFLKMHDRLKSNLLDSASVRYQKLISERKDLADRIPQYLLASYLNVKPETISRIRKKLSTQ